MNQVYLIENGSLKFRKAWALQQKLAGHVTRHRDIHFFILTEHEAVITIGKSGSRNNLLVRPEFLKRHNIDLEEIDRGGDITFHGPGQTVGYPILDLKAFKKDVHWYLRTLEEVIIRTLKLFDITAGRVEGLTGVWVGDAKICALGVKITRWVTMHGFALNVNTDLDYFRYIVPCGISDKQVTSISRLIGNNVDQKHVNKELVGQFEQVFGVTCLNPADSLVNTIESPTYIQEY